MPLLLKPISREDVPRQLTAMQSPNLQCFKTLQTEAERIVSVF